MYEVKCDKCLTPQISADGACKICGTPLEKGRAAAGVDGAQSGTQSFLLPADQPIFFPVSKTKFIVMSLTTLGMYQVFWAFKGWLYVQTKSGQKMAAGWRAWFSVLYLLPLLKEILSTDAAMNLPAGQNSFKPMTVFLFWLMLTLSSRLPGAVWLISFLSFVPLLPVLDYVEAMNRSAGKENLINSKFSMANIIWIVIGSVMLVLVVIGSFMPNQS